ncbi:CD2 antigen cytoplasmic tail-binding protein 2-like isoform X4 [Triticum dicoccoides]|uniref:CD2 antigen cytoplasmic tail-binding protein 2-like isoform X4 n=1 Tax=Triticum dicoccoides TaxID=85692 RepID=UPI0018918AAF|nr:CD2 antigen cytoplasmic tail-binding protein 2-like isoform X4 [Triticum dicoccoides]
MDPTAPQRGTKRPLPAAAAGDDDDDRSALGDRKVRFPKGKKAKYRDPAAAGSSGEGGAAAEDIDELMNPELAAVKRARRRHRRDGDDTQGTANVKGFEMRYKDDANFIDDGIEIEPFNLEQEREEGYFDENGNFVEFARGNDMKDAWLDNVEVDTKFAGKVQKKKGKEEEFQDLSSDDIGKIKRRIANMLEPAETIIQALKRLKSTSTDNRGRMTEGTKRIFDELTEAAMKLMENGEYNVYSDDRETFVREAEGYERLARARLGIPEVEEDIFADATESGPTTTPLLEMDSGPSAANTSATTAIADDDDSNFDMFGENDDTDVNPDSDAKTLDSGCNPEPVPQDASGTSEVGNGSADSDYVYDPSSGNSTGYYYDAASGCYCAASTGTWYSYDEQSGTYTEMLGEQTGMHKEIEGEGVKE